MFSYSRMVRYPIALFLTLFILIDFPKHILTISINISINNKFGFKEVTGQNF